MPIVEHVVLSAEPPLADTSADLEDSGTAKFAVAGESISVYVERNGGCPVLFVHGNSSTKSVWAHQFAVARQHGRTVIAPDLPGHGDSEDSSSPELTYSFPGYAMVISALLDHLEIRAVDLVGWSLGGHIGLQLFATDARVRSLLIVGTPPALSAEAFEQAFYSSQDMQLTGKADFSEADAIAYGTAMMGRRNLLSRKLLQSIKRTDGRARQFMVANALRGYGIDQRAAVESINKPLCIIHGECEPFVRLDYFSTLRYRALWKNRIFVIGGAGHAPHWEQPAPFNHILAMFLSYSQIEFAN